MPWEGVEHRLDALRRVQLASLVPNQSLAEDLRQARHAGGPEVLSRWTSGSHSVARACASRQTTRGGARNGEPPSREGGGRRRGATALRRLERGVAHGVPRPQRRGDRPAATFAAGSRRRLKVYKNTLVRFAAQDLGLEIQDLLTGPTAIAFVEGDPVNVAKALRDFARTNPALVVKGGLLGNRSLTAAETQALADVEPREVLLAKLAGVIAAPMVQFAGLLQALPRNLAYGLQALIDQQGGVPEADAPAAEPRRPRPSPRHPPPSRGIRRRAEATCRRRTGREPSHRPTRPRPNHERRTER